MLFVNCFNTNDWSTAATAGADDFDSLADPDMGGRPPIDQKWGLITAAKTPGASYHLNP